MGDGFGEDLLWYVLPDGRYLHFGESKPCLCGHRVKVITRISIAVDGKTRLESRCLCPKCIKLKRGEVIVSHFDVEERIIRDGLPR